MATQHSELPETLRSSAPLGAPLCNIQASAGLAEPVHSNDLLKGNKTVAIEHNGAVYRLQATRLGKLILTK